MSMSLRDQLLKAGLINKKQANEAERQQQRQERQSPPKQRRAGASDRPPVPQSGQGEKAARDQALNRQQNEKAAKKALLAQIKQLIEQNRLPTVEDGDFYNFVDGNKIRRIPVNASIRNRLCRGEIAIVRHEGRYDLVPTAIATRIRERDDRVFISFGVGKDSAHSDEAYQGFSVPDDLIW
jgi:uncharacterized protein YaiL (DUF2058 family)